MQEQRWRHEIDIHGLTSKTASEDKIASGKRCIHDEEKNEGDQEICDLKDCSGRRLFDAESLASAIEQAAVCKECKEGSLVLREDGRMGLASQMTFQCAHCGEETAFSTDCKTGRFYPVNKSAVFASKLIGRGYAGLSKFCSILDVPGPMAKRTYEKCSKEIKDAAEKIMERCLGSKTGQEGKENQPGRNEH